MEGVVSGDPDKVEGADPRAKDVSVPAVEEVAVAVDLLHLQRPTQRCYWPYQ